MADVIRPLIKSWKGQTGSGEWITGATPPARLEYLIGLADRVAGLLTAWASPGMCNEFTSSTGYHGVPVPPAVAALQVRATCTWEAPKGATTTPANIEVQAQASGTGAYDNIKISPSGDLGGKIAWPPTGPIEVVTASESWQPTPTEEMDRLGVWTPTLAGSGIERIQASGCTGLCLRPYFAGDLTGL